MLGVTAVDDKFDSVTAWMHEQVLQREQTTKKKCIEKKKATKTFHWRHSAKCILSSASILIFGKLFFSFLRFRVREEKAYWCVARSRAGSSRAPHSLSRPRCSRFFREKNKTDFCQLMYFDSDYQIHVLELISLTRNKQNNIYEYHLMKQTSLFAHLNYQFGHVRLAVNLGLIRDLDKCSFSTCRS